MLCVKCAVELCACVVWERVVCECVVCECIVCGVETVLICGVCAWM